jgi:membrane fusion protein, multidrug efflux system
MARPVTTSTQSSAVSLRISSLAGIGIAAALVTVIVGSLYTRKAMTAPPPPRPATPVEAVSYQPQTSYQREVSYLGLVVAGRKAQLGFEIPGRIATLPLRQGSPVAAGDVIATLDDSALLAKRRATAAELEQAEAELELAKLKSKRQADLSTSGAVSKEAYDETRLRALALTSRVEAVAAHLSSIDIELYKLQLIAPYDGIIADRFVHPGAVISAGTPVVRLIETSAQEAHIGVSARRASELMPDNIYTLEIRDEPADAVLLSVRPDVNPTTRATIAVFALPASVKALDGEPVTLQMKETVELHGGWLPLEALIEGRRGVWTVMRIEAQGDSYISRKEMVEVLDVRGSQAYVRGTLNNGDRVLASGLHRVSAGAPLTILGEN